MSWKGVKNQSIKADIEAWCDEMDINNYIINSQGEIDVDGNVDLSGKNFEELPYKFGRVNRYFDICNNKNLTSLKNCPNYVGGYFACNSCTRLDSLEGCPKEVNGNFYCRRCKRKFKEKEIISLCKVDQFQLYL